MPTSKPRKKPTRLEEDGEDSSLLSLLDTLSNGLGAAVLLGLIFSLTRAEEPVSLSASEAILVEIRWSDPNALMNLRVRPPWPKCTSYELNLTEERTRSGDVVTQKCGDHSIRFVTYGLSQRGDDALLAADSNTRSALVLVLGPEGTTWEADATWRLGVRYFNRQEPIDRWREPLRKVVKVHTTVTIGDVSREARPNLEKEQELSLGGILEIAPIKVVPR